jgi:CDP-glycerol glycerophosphotransferase
VLLRFLKLLLYFASGFAPRNRRRVLFGAWMGQKFADNPKFLLLHLVSERPELELIWCGHEQVRSQLPPDLRVQFVRYGSVAALKAMLTCGACFVTHSARDVGRFNLLRGAVLVYLGHGLAVKHMGARDRPMASATLTSIRQVLRSPNSFSYYISASDEHRDKLLLEYGANNIRPEHILGVGQPRVDYLIDAVRSGKAAAERKRFFEEHNLPRAKSMITYMPTFREAGPTFSFAELAGERLTQLESLLADFDAILVEKSHFRGANLDAVSPRSQVQASRIVRLSAGGSIDTQELLLATDLLITDYSGCYFDFLMLDRPILHFTYDHEFYAHRERGLYFDLETVAAGPVVSDCSQLLAEIAENLRNPARHASRRERVRNRFFEHERGVSCRQIVRLLGWAQLNTNGSMQTDRIELTRSESMSPGRPAGSDRS